MADEIEQRVLMGRVGAPYGVKGWLWIHSDTRPIDNIFDYAEWQIGTGDNWQTFNVLEGRPQGKSLIARLANEEGQVIADRNQAAELTNAVVAVWRNEMPQLPDGEYYWTDLIGLEVLTESGQGLGKVETLMETGANNVLVVRGERERLIPFVPGQVVKNVDLQKTVITVDWDPEF